MDWHARIAELRAATLAASDDLLESLDGERLYAICLQTDDGGMSVGFCANSEQGYAASRAAAAQARELDASYDAYLRWDSAEWRYEMAGDAHFAQANRAFIAAATTDTGEDFGTYFDQLLEAMSDALAHLRAERADALEDVTLFVTITDSDAAEAVEARSATRLNPPEAAAAFVRRFG